MSNSASFRWRFFRAGGFDQVKLETGADLMNLDQLDQKLWVALACPTTGLEFDPKTLALIDTDKDGRIRVPELIAAVKWAGAMLKNPDDLVKGGDSLPLSAIHDATPDGRQLLASAKHILANLGKADAPAITLADTTDPAMFAQTRFNGDGIVPADAAGDDATRAVINEIIDYFGAETDRSGKPGVNQVKADQFFAEVQAYSAWWQKAEGDATILPLGEGAFVAGQAVSAVKAKVDDYFARCRLAAFDTRALSALNRAETDFLALAAKDLTLSSPEIAGFPLARIEAGKPLPLQEGVNPAWAEAISTFQTAAVNPLQGNKTAITESEWALLLAKLGPFENWRAGKTGAAVEKLGLQRVREILGGRTREKVGALIAEDKMVEPEFTAIAAVEKLVRYYRDLHKLCNNFVSFRDFYGRKDKAIFQAGTLFLDQRSCDLCLAVEDAGKHAVMAALAGTYLAYCDCVRKSSGEKMQILAAFTNGDSDNLMAGRNGIFYDRKGRDWDATITKIVDNPISIRQAFWSPYKKFVRMVEEQVAKRAAAADSSASDKLAQAAVNVSKADQLAQQNKPAGPKKLDVGVVAALGVAVGAISGALASLAAGLVKLAPWQIPLVFVGVILLISIPSMVIAYIKLRKRNLGPILDANGWAVNARAKINVPFGASLTRIAALPPGAQRDLVDPFAEKKGPWKLWLFLLVVAALAFGWWQGKLDKYLPNQARSISVFGTNAPAYLPPPPATNAVPASTNSPSKM